MTLVKGTIFYAAWLISEKSAASVAGAGPSVFVDVSAQVVQRGELTSGIATDDPVDPVAAVESDVIVCSANHRRVSVVGVSRCPPR